MFVLNGRVNVPLRSTIVKDIISGFREKLASNSHVPYARCLCERKKGAISDPDPDFSNNDNRTPLSTLEKFKIFKDQDSPVILDVLEERFKALQIDSEHVDEFEGLNLKRGIEGVYDIEDLVELLYREKAQNIFVVKIPKELKYVRYVVVVSGKSVRHMQALAEFVRRVYKKKRHNGDLIPKIEGEKSKDWIALDLGNIALHIFSENVRLSYDLESLWSLGVEFDELSRLPDDPLLELLQKHSVYLGDLQPDSSCK